MKMSSNRKPSGNIHRIREFELEKVNLADEFDILQIVGEGWFGKILLVEHRATDTEMVLKALPKPYVSLRDFYREFHYGLHLGVHKNIVTTYDVAFETAGFYVFSQEYAPLGDLTSNVLETGIGELHTKRVAKQIASALDFMHSKEMVHRDVKLDNVLVCRSDFSRVKLCDFGESRKTESLVHRRNEWLPYSPPEVLCIKTDDTYKALPTHDIWQYGIVIFVCLTGCLPWQKAASDDPRYTRYIAWQNSSMVIPIKRTPKLFKLISSRCCKLFRKILEPNQERRPKNLNDVHKFLDDRWLAKGAEKDMLASEPDELCPSMYSFHSNLEEKTKLLSTLAQHGIEVTVDRVAKKNRIREWIQSSVITEEDEDDDSGSTTPSSINQSRAPIPGHISAVRAMEQIAQKKIVTTIKDASNKHIDPRTGIIQMGPSEMGLSNNSSNNANGGGGGDDDDNIYNNYDNKNSVKKHHQTMNGQKSEQYHHHHHHHHHHQQQSNDEHIETPRRHIVPQQPQQPTRQKFKMKNNKLTDTESQIITPQTNSTNSSYYSSVDKQLNNDKQLDILMKNGQPQPQPQYYSNNKINNSNNSNYNNINKYNSNNNYDDINHSSSSVKDVTQIELNNNQFTPLYVATTIQQMTDNLIKNQIMDSGYGSLDKLKFDAIPNTINSNIVNNNKSVSTTLASQSPVLTKRSSIKSSQSDYLSIDSNFAMDPNPFNSDDDLEEYNQRGSTGFVNLIGNGVLTTTTNNPLSHAKTNATMKDTAYDRIKLKKKIK